MLAALLTPLHELMIDVGQTGVIFNDTGTKRTGRDTGEPRVITTELHPEASGSEYLQYLAALQQMVHDVSGVAVPPPGSAKCMYPIPKLDSTVKYLQAALDELKA